MEIEKIAHYRIIGKPRKGGMAFVYRARDEKLDRDIALKVLPKQLTFDENFVNRFIQEARSSARLEHHNIVRIYEADKSGDYYYIAMEFLEGDTLHQCIRDKGAMEPDKALGIIRQVALALSYAHGKDLIHRDIKPGNIMLCPDGRVVLMDFGIAKAASDSDLTQAGTIIGSPEYLSPEQAEGKRVDGRADLYSLGVVLFEALTGSVPFKSETPFATAMMHVKEPPPTPSSIKVMPANVEYLTLRMLAKNPSDRFESAADLIKTIDNLDGVPSSVIKKVRQTAARPYSPTPTPGSIQAPSQNKKPVIALIGVLVLLAVVVISIAVSMMRQQSNAPLPKGGSVDGKKINTSKTAAPNASSSQGIDELIAEGKAFLEVKQYQRAVDRLQKAVDAAPNNAMAAALLGNAFYNMGSLDKALVHLEKALSVDPSIVAARKDLGAVYLQKNRVNESVTMFAQVLKEKPSDPDAESIRKIVKNAAGRMADEGYALFMNGKTTEAIAKYERVLEITPENVNIHKDIAGMYIQAGNKAMALSHLQKALELSPNSSDKDKIQGMIQQMGK